MRYQVIEFRHGRSVARVDYDEGEQNAARKTAAEWAEDLGFGWKRAALARVTISQDGPDRYFAEDSDGKEFARIEVLEVK